MTIITHPRPTSYSRLVKALVLVLVLVVAGLSDGDGEGDGCHQHLVFDSTVDSR
jgi:hypothetical protein